VDLATQFKQTVTPPTQRSGLPEGGGTSPAVRRQVQKIVASSGFANAERMSRFLQFTVEHTLQNRGAELKEYLIGVEVFDRTANYDPRLDPVVRVEARRLRSKLASYYEADGRNDTLLIEFPKGTYVPVFRERTQKAAAPAAAEHGSTIAVLPFANLSPDPENEYFSDGLTPELIHLLTKVDGLRVVAWNSSSQLKGKTPDPYSVGQQLKVGSVLTGSVRGASVHLRITAQLVDTSNGYYLWSETYDREMQDVFAIQEEISSAIVKTLSKKLVGAVSELKCNTPNLEAYNLYLKGRFHWNKRTGPGLNRSVQYFTEAIAVDQDFAMAYSGLADAYTLLADYGVLHPSEAMPQAKAAAQRALDLDPLLGEAEASLGLIRGLYDWQWDTAEKHYRRAIELNPGYSTTHHWYAVDHMAMLGRMEEAREEIEIARALDPLSPIIREAIGFLAMLDRRYEEAIAHYREEVELDPFFYKGYTSMGRAYIQLGMYEEAIAHLEKGRSLAGDVPNILGALGQAWALSGNTAEARKFLKQLQQLSKTSYIPCSGIALIHLGLGEKEKALEILEAGCEQRHLVLATLKVHPAYDDLRGEPRFSAILQRMGLLPGL
jgi:TolB-like protein/Flp pilus assembly protein TadD